MQGGKPSPLSSKFENITLTGWHKGEKQWEIKARFVEVSKDKRITNFKQITEGIFFQEGKPVLYFQADEAKYNSGTLDLEIKGKIKLSSLPEAEKKGVVLTTEELCWLAKERRLVSKGKVKLTSANNTLEGDYLIADAKLEGVEIKGNVKGRFDLEGKGTTNKHE